MKFKTISAADVAVLREARKVLKRLKKKENKLNAIEDDALVDKSKDWKMPALKHWRMLDELEALHVAIMRDDECDGELYLEAQ